MGNNNITQETNKKSSISTIKNNVMAHQSTICSKKQTYMSQA